MTRADAARQAIAGRGDIHAINLPHRRGRLQHGGGFAVIVQADDLLALSTVVVCRLQPPDA